MDTDYVRKTGKFGRVKNQFVTSNELCWRHAESRTPVHISPGGGWQKTQNGEAVDAAQTGRSCFLPWRGVLPPLSARFAHWAARENLSGFPAKSCSRLDGRTTRVKRTALVQYWGGARRRRRPVLEKSCLNGRGNGRNVEETAWLNEPVAREGPALWMVVVGRWFTRADLLTFIPTFIQMKRNSCSVLQTIKRER